MTHTKNIKSSQQHYDYMLLALMPLIVCASVIYSFRVLLICATAFVTARIVDVATAVARKQEIDAGDKSSTVAALTFCMMLPVSVPLCPCRTMSRFRTAVLLRRRLNPYGKVLPFLRLFR